MTQSLLSQTVLLSEASKALRALAPADSSASLSTFLVSTLLRPPGLLSVTCQHRLTPGPSQLLSPLPGVLAAPQDRTLCVQAHYTHSLHPGLWVYLVVFSHSVGFRLSSAQRGSPQPPIQNQSLLCFSKFPVCFLLPTYYNLFFSLLF